MWRGWPGCDTLKLTVNPPLAWGTTYDLIPPLAWVQARFIARGEKEHFEVPFLSCGGKKGETGKTGGRGGSLHWAKRSIFPRVFVKESYCKKGAFSLALGCFCAIATVSGTLRFYGQARFIARGGKEHFPPCVCKRIVL